MFDNLIAAGEMPVTIAVCVNPGVVPGGEGNQDRFNRSFEYDTVSDRYARFLIEELLPVVEQKYALTDDPNLRGIAGSSSGAIAAFGVAWHRPDKFRRVFSTVGTFVGLRGGNEYPTLVRKTEPKPIRVFLQDGSNDLNIYAGSWWNANLTMLSALQWAGYQVKNEWGTGGHNGKHGGAILPDAMRWLWQDYETPIDVNVDEHPELKQRLIGGEDWELVSSGHQFTEGPAVAPSGDVYFADPPRGEIWRIKNPLGENPESEKFANVPGVSGLMFDATGRLYACSNRHKKVVRIDSGRTQVTIAEGMGCNDLVVLDHGIYTTSPQDSSIYYVSLDDAANPLRQAVKAATGPNRPNGLIVTPDRRFLLVVDSAGRYVWSYRIEADGKLTAGQPYSYLHLPSDEVLTGADGATMTSDGALIVATKLGLQIFDQPGRVHVIMSRPPGDKLSNCVLAEQTLFVTAGQNVYRRKTKMTGMAPWQTAIQPPKPRL